MKKTIAWGFAFASFAACIFFAWWVIQDAWIGSFPNAKLPDNYQFWLNIKAMLTVTFFIGSIVFMVSALRTKSP